MGDGQMSVLPVNKGIFRTSNKEQMVFRIAITLCLGLYYRFSGGKQRTTKEYLMADGQMSVLPVAFSLMASFMSAITLLGVSQVRKHR
jgi:solute carrier family 5 (sodium-coupled monocarboxylate transporter), member 8/12